MAIHTILVTGANGQLGWELGQLAKLFPAFKFVFVDRSQLDLSFPETFEKIIHRTSDYPWKNDPWRFNFQLSTTFRRGVKG